MKIYVVIYESRQPSTPKVFAFRHENEAENKVTSIVCKHAKKRKYMEVLDLLEQGLVEDAIKRWRALNEKVRLLVAPVDVTVAEGATWCCPRCGSDLFVGNELPATRTSCDFYEMRCQQGHVWEVQHELQDDSLVFHSIGDYT